MYCFNTLDEIIRIVKNKLFKHTYRNKTYTVKYIQKGRFKRTYICITYLVLKLCLVIFCTYYVSWINKKFFRWTISPEWKCVKGPSEMFVLIETQHKYFKLIIDMHYLKHYLFWIPLMCWFTCQLSRKEQTWLLWITIYSTADIVVHSWGSQYICRKMYLPMYLKINYGT